MQVIRCTSALEAARRTADRVAAALARPAPRLGLATGGTMVPVYADLVARGLDWSRAETFNLDEYVGLGSTHPASYQRYMDGQLFDRLTHPPRAHHLPRGDSPCPSEEARAYEARIARAGGIDLQLLGIGRNGHIGFNEPGAPFDSRTRVVTLTESTRAANARFFGPDASPPHEAISMGIATILEARELVLLATGPAKADAVARMLHDPPSPACPATALRRHGAVTVILDPDAGARI